MRKHDVRKWLHAILDLLPVILIPVFMIYSHRHEINDGSIQVQEKEVVDYNQLIPNVSLESDDYFSVTKISDYYYNFQGDFSGERSYTLAQYDDLPIELGSTFYVRTSINASHFTFRFYSHDVLSGSYFQDVTIETPSSSIYTSVTLSRFTSLYRVALIKWTHYDSFNINLYLQLFNVSQMYGLGNEPTLQDFGVVFPNNDYEYSLSKNMLVNKSTLTTYNDTDIMSQMTYQLYNSVDKYFNMGNVFNLGGLYDWFNLNIFNGQAPIYIFIVWQIALYEFVMDLLFLLYGLFMWFIDMIQKLMEKPLNSVR